MNNRALQDVSHYHLESLLGSGGMGQVYQAVDRRDGSLVALKLIHEYLAEDESFRERFEREAHVGALLRSPYVVRLLEYGHDQGVYFIATEFVEGESIRDMLKRGPLEVSKAVRIAGQVARALEEAQARGIVHRDIKPDNILVGATGSAKVMDFGVARMVGSATMTVTGNFLGTLLYAAPEVFDGNPEFRSDIYSLGATLFHMLAGRPPFSGSTLDLLRHHRETPVPIDLLRACPTQLAEIVRRCMEKTPEGRFSSASELAGELDHALRTVREEVVPRTPAVLVAPSAPAALPDQARTELESAAVHEEETLLLAQTPSEPPAVESEAAPVKRELPLDRAEPVPPRTRSLRPRSPRLRTFLSHRLAVASIILGIALAGGVLAALVLGGFGGGGSTRTVGTEELAQMALNVDDVRALLVGFDPNEPKSALVSNDALAAYSCNPEQAAADNAKFDRVNGYARTYQARNFSDLFAVAVQLDLYSNARDAGQAFDIEVTQARARRGTADCNGNTLVDVAETGTNSVGQKSVALTERRSDTLASPGVVADFAANVRGTQDDALRTAEEVTSYSTTIEFVRGPVVGRLVLHAFTARDYLGTSIALAGMLDARIDRVLKSETPEPWPTNTVTVAPTRAISPTETNTLTPTASPKKTVTPRPATRPTNGSVAIPTVAPPDTEATCQQPRETPASGGSTSLSVGSLTMCVGQSGTVQLIALGIGFPGLGSWEVLVSYIDENITLTGCSAQQGGACNSYFAPSVVKVAGGSASGLTGNTVLALLTFRCDRPNVSSTVLPYLDISDPVFNDASIGSPQPIFPNSIAGSVACEER